MNFAHGTSPRAEVTSHTPVELTSNKAIEEAAIRLVIELDSAAGRQARDVRYVGATVDIESPPRHIEVKAAGRSSRGFELSAVIRISRFLGSSGLRGDRACRSSAEHPPTRPGASASLR